MNAPFVSPEALLNPAQTREFIDALFGGLAGCVNFRAFSDADKSAPQNEWCEIGPNLAD